MNTKRMLLITTGMISVFFLVFLSTAGAGEKSGEASLSKSAKAEALSGGKVDINTAGPDQLATLPGIGAKTAERIKQYRGENGKFKDLEDLKKVRGIGDKNFEKIRPFIKI